MPVPSNRNDSGIKGRREVGEPIENQYTRSLEMKTYHTLDFHVSSYVPVVVDGAKRGLDPLRNALPFHRFCPDPNAKTRGGRSVRARELTGTGNKPIYQTRKREGGRQRVRYRGRTVDHSYSHARLIMCRMGICVCMFLWIFHAGGQERVPGRAICLCLRGPLYVSVCMFVSCRHFVTIAQLASVAHRQSKNFPSMDRVNVCSPGQ